MRSISRIPLSSIHCARRKLSPKVYHFAQCMERGDIFPPVRLRRNSNGSLEISDGRHRWAAAKLLGKETILARYWKELK